MKKKTLLIVLLFVVVSYYYPLLFSQQVDEYYVVNDDGINIKESPDINAKNIEYTFRKKTITKQLRITHVVKLIEKDENIAIIGNNKGKWAYIDTGHRFPGTKEFIKGWVFDYYLSGINDFTPLNSLKNNMQLEWADGDAVFKYEFYKNGKCKIINTNEIGTLYVDKTRRIIVPVFDSNKKYRIHKYLFDTIKSQNTFFLNGAGLVCIASGEPPSYTTCAKIIR